MKLYIVRHGESESNLQETVQGADSPLSDLGVKQSESVAERVSKLPIDIILASDYERTKQTCELILKKVNKPYKFTPLLREFSRPSEFMGQSFSSPEVRKMLDSLVEHANDPDWHYSDEENFTDLKKRAKNLIKYALQENKEHILLVSHGNFIRMLVLVMMLGDDVTPELYYRFMKFFWTKNTGITVCDYKKDKNEWKLLTWNDHAHLAE